MRSMPCRKRPRDVAAKSVHGKAMAAGKRDAPTCTDCHSEHKIEALKGDSALEISDVCGRCHASVYIGCQIQSPGGPGENLRRKLSWSGRAKRFHRGRQLRQLPRLPQNPAFLRPGLHDQHKPPRHHLRKMPSGRGQNVRERKNSRGHFRHAGERAHWRERSTGGCGGFIWR